MSDTRSAGVRSDETTQRLRTVLESAGHAIIAELIVADEQDQVAAAITGLADGDDAPDVILTSGGTGLGPRDVTPEATMSVVERVAPGIAELLRTTSAAETQHAWLSRGVAGIRRRTIIVNLPGSPRGAESCTSTLLPLLPHAASMMAGGGH